ncbi:MAG: hypothetical protein DHS20C02_09570 [Micavibrio sp.]|nr:MAG: hypothetical protein DHS20C02_09570 [Micavibrio sp.]
MSGIGDFLEDIQSWFDDSFKMGAEESSTLPVIYIDSTQLTGNQLENGDILRDMLEEQAPGITQNASSAQLMEIAAFAKHGGPFALTIKDNSLEVCVVNELTGYERDMDSLMQKALGPGLAPFPGFNEHWQHGIGIHEGEHCNQPPTSAAIPFSEQFIEMLGKEAGADDSAYKYFDRRGFEDMAQAWQDFRAINTVFDTAHATNGIAPLNATNEQVFAAQNAGHVLFSKVGYELGISADESKDLFIFEKEKFLETVDKLLDEGKFDPVEGQPLQSPEIKKIIEDFALALDHRVIKTPSPALNNDSAYISSVSPDIDLNEIEGGKPTIVSSMTSDKMEIGGVSANSFFSSHAHPELAQERLEAAQAQTLEQTPVQTQELGSPSESVPASNVMAPANA